MVPDYRFFRRWPGDDEAEGAGQMQQPFGAASSACGRRGCGNVLPQDASAVLEEYRGLQEAQRVTGLGLWSFCHPCQPWQAGTLSEECRRIAGLPASETSLSFHRLLRQVHPADRGCLLSAVQAAMRDGASFEIELRLLGAGAAPRWLRLTGQLPQIASGLNSRLHGTVMDISRRKAAELRQAMEHAVARVLAEAGNPADTIPDLLKTMGRTLGWECGAAWMLDRADGSLIREAVWLAPHGQADACYRMAPARAFPAFCNSLIRNALHRNEPDWISDIGASPADAALPHAKQSGLRTGLAFPLAAGKDVLGIIELYSNAVHDLDPDLLRSAQFIGRQVGQFFQRHQAEQALRESEAHFRALVEQASDSFYVHDADGRLIDVNQRACDSLGYERAELLAMNLSGIDVDLGPHGLRFQLGSLLSGTPVALESRHLRRDGSIFPVEMRTGPIRINGRQYLLSLVRDITERKRMQDQLRHLAYHDSLTDLPNRAMFNRHLGHALAQASCHGRRLALLFIDLDRFKNINDTLGHEVGDRLLQEMARRLTASLRAGDMLARLGGDEFVVLMEEVRGPEQVTPVARQILAALVREFHLEGQSVHVTASIGISMYPQDGQDESALMKHADVAMYRAKYGGKNNFQYYSAQTDSHSRARLALESELRRALENDELVLYYQAKVDARTDRINGCEVLVRWRHPEQGMLLPERFIAVAEETGLIIPLTKWVLREACRQNQAWLARGFAPGHVAVNLSARQFIDENLLEDVQATLTETGMDPAYLELEITESMMMHDVQRTSEVLAALKALGIRIAMDDFGMGYSSLSHLKQFPIDIIKIDRSFINDVPGDRADEAIADAIISMGKSLRIVVVAEGVEAAEHCNSCAAAAATKSRASSSASRCRQ